uniref:E3 ubiquitin-protein ligase SMURF2-like isoform X2 n=1 Tax=Styela clava TaxID=7725 RepID=UPI00193AA26F|nr:E3 ubiquitin-protein ligase SMURF2-like isoform X2 [Styela clava]XP_039257694.1 E3 ubiquitin-protein ligase SMURF2-like isoform X2 [Styela clava]
MAAADGRRAAVNKIRLTVFGAKNLSKRDFCRLPDPFAKIEVKGSGQSYSSNICKATLDPKWNEHYDLYVSKSDSIEISIWNQRKIHKKKGGGGFLGCIRIMSNAIGRLKDTGPQRLDLCKRQTEENNQEPIRGQIVVSIVSRDHEDRIPSNAVLNASMFTNNNPLDGANNLPDGWEARPTATGRIQYVNHYTKTIQFERPTRPAVPHGPMRSASAIVTNGNRSSGSNLQRRSMPPSNGNRSSMTETSINSLNGDGTPDRRRDYMTRNTLHRDGVIAMPLPEGYEQRTTQQGQVYFLHTQTGVSTWHDPRIPRQLTHINGDDLGQLPPGWEMRTTSTGRVYYVDHSSRTTQFTDPRISQYIDQLQKRGNGNATEDMENDPQLPKYKRDLVQKMKVLRSELLTQQPQTGHCRMEVSRTEVFEDSYRQVMKMRPKELKKRLMVKFKGEEGLDYGGIAREWLYLLSHEMLNPYYGLFQYSREDIYTLQINPDSSINPEHLSYFHFVGRILGMAVFHGHYLDGGFTMPFYKQLLGKPLSLEDMQQVDPELYTSMHWILTNDITDVLDHTFCVEQDSFGKRVEHELKPGGSEIEVSEDNKKEYVRLYVKWRFLRGIEAQYLSLSKGFYEIVPQHLLRPFDERELELIISGLGKIDIKDWKKYTKYKHCNQDSNIVKWFWRTVESYDEEKRARLLQFVTGSARVPLQGFKGLQGSTGTQGPRLFTIQFVDCKTDCLPKAHTCFNRIDIPNYENYDKLRDKITCAIENTCGFFTE